MNKVPATNFMATVAANVDNVNISDQEFRAFIRDTLPIVDYIRYPENKDANTKNK